MTITPRSRKPGRRWPSNGAMARLLPALALLVLAGCGGSSTPTTPTPQLPTIGGTYRNGNALWQYTLTRIRDGSTAHLNCGGSATVTQTGATFGGSFQMAGGDCDPTPQTGTLTNGALRSDGGVNFGINIPGSNGDALAVLFGCVTLSGTSAFNGAVTGSQIDASQSLQISCPSDGTINITLRLFGTR